MIHLKKIIDILGNKKPRTDFESQRSQKTERKNDRQLELKDYPVYLNETPRSLGTTQLPDIGIFLWPSLTFFMLFYQLRKFKFFTYHIFYFILLGKEMNKQLHNYKLIKLAMKK